MGRMGDNHSLRGSGFAVSFTMSTISWEFEIKLLPVV